MVLATVPEYEPCPKAVPALIVVRQPVVVVELTDGSLPVCGELLYAHIFQSKAGTKLYCWIQTFPIRI